VTPQLLYRIFPPLIKHTPAAADFARSELNQMGPMRRDEKLLLVVFLVVAALWVIKGLGGLIPVFRVPQINDMLTYITALDYSIPPLVGVAILLIGGVLEWGDVLGERGAWDVFIWYGGLVRMAEALSESGITNRFADAAGNFTANWVWWLALGGLLLLYFYAHYGFASITAHATAMYKPFLIVIIAAGAPSYLAVLSLAYFSNLSASLTHYGTTPAPIYFGANFVTQRRWWTIGLIASLINIPIWIVIGFTWWKVLGLW
jgi:DASS family divalent anion:Na+ symporter